jgi:20S proteasome alpha/beta subunit
MTIAIGAICDGGKAAVLVADRLRVTGGTELETNESKIRILSDSAAIGLSWSDGTDVDLIEYYMLRLTGNVGGLSMRELARRIKDRFLRIRKSLMHSRMRMFGLTLSEFHLAALKNPTTQFIDKLYSEIVGVKNSVSGVLVGLDKSGDAHVYFVSEQQMFHNDGYGYQATGSGTDLAMDSLRRRKFHSGMSLAEAAYYAYEAKKSAEMAHGVGPKTDIAILRAGRPAILLQELDNMNPLSFLEETRQKYLPARLSPEDVQSISDRLMQQ